MYKFNVKLSLVFGLLSFITAIAVGYYITHINTKKLEKRSSEALMMLSKNIVDILDREMFERYKEVKFVSELSIMKNEKTPMKLKRELINQLKNNFNHHRWVGYADREGKVLIGSDNYLEGKNVKARPWHPGGLKGPYIGNVHDALLLAKLLPNTSGEAIYFLDIAFPVKNYNNEVIGVLCTHLDWQWTRDLIRSIQKENGTEIFLVAKDGLILVGPNKTERKELQSISKEIFEDEFSGFVEWKDSTERYLTAQSISKGFKDYKGFEWRIIVRQSVNDTFAFKEYDHLHIFAIALLAALIASLTGAIISYIMTLPLGQLFQTVNQFTNTKKAQGISQLNENLKSMYEKLNMESELKNTAEKKVELALNVFEQSTEGLLITDHKNNIMLTNKAFNHITGYSNDDVYGMNPKILSSKTHTKEFYEKLWEQIDTLGKWEGTIHNRKKDGTIYDQYLKISIIKDSSGKLQHYIGTFRAEA